MEAHAFHSCCQGGFCRRHFTTKPSPKRNTHCPLSPGSDRDLTGMCLLEMQAICPLAGCQGKTMSQCTLLLVSLSPGWVPKPCCWSAAIPQTLSWFLDATVCQHFQLGQAGNPPQALLVNKILTVIQTTQKQKQWGWLGSRNRLFSHHCVLWQTEM